MNPTKFGSPKMDIYNSTYEFLKHAFKSVKTNKKSKNTQRPTDGARWSVTPGQGRRSGQPYLTGGEITGDEGDTNMFPTTSHVSWW